MHALPIFGSLEPWILMRFDATMQREGIIRRSLPTKS
jgi:hypothetical protein